MKGTGASGMVCQADREMKEIAGKRFMLIND
jgi:hypothetical protein